jgi:hypothetical protein
MRHQEGHPSRIRDRPGINLHAAACDSWHTVRLGCPIYRRRVCSVSLGDVLASLSTSRSLDTATHLVRVLGPEERHIRQS